MANKRKTNGSKTNGSTHKVQSLFTDGLSGLNNILQSIEGGVEKAVSTVRKQGLKTGASVVKGFDVLSDNINVSDIRDKAFEKTDELKDELKKEIKRIRKLSGNLLESLKGMDVNLDTSVVLSKIRENLSLVYTRAQELEMVEFAKGKISDTKNQVFTMLQIPSQVELDNLVRKVVSLEKKIKTISKHSARV